MFTPFAFVKPTIITDQLAMYLDPSTGFVNGKWIDSINGLEWTKSGSNLNFVDNNYLTGFTTSSDYLQTDADINATINATNDAAFTYEFWWYAPTSYGASTLAIPWAFKPTGQNEYRFRWLGSSFASPNGQLQTLAPQNIEVNYDYSSATEFEGKWIHHAMVFTYNIGGGESSLKYYYQYAGIGISSVEATKAQSAYTRTGYATSGPHRIGQGTDGAGPLLGGNIGTMRIYNKALSQAEIEHNYNIEKSRYN